MLCSKNKILGVESHDFSQADKEISACKAEESHKMTTIFTQNDKPRTILRENSCHFGNLLSLANNHF